MKSTTIDLLACPNCQMPLVFIGTDGEIILTGNLTCLQCRKDYPILNGIPYFIQTAELTGFNRCFSRMYDWFSWIYTCSLVTNWSQADLLPSCAILYTRVSFLPRSEAC